MSFFHIVQYELLRFSFAFKVKIILLIAAFLGVRIIPFFWRCIRHISWICFFLFFIDGVVTINFKNVMFILFVKFHFILSFSAMTTKVTRHRRLLNFITVYIFGFQNCFTNIVFTIQRCFLKGQSFFGSQKFFSLCLVSSLSWRAHLVLDFGSRHFFIVLCVQGEYKAAVNFEREVDSPALAGQCLVKG